VKLLLDTNTLLWWFADSLRLPPAIEALVDDPAHVIMVSAASAWEICTKVRVGKLPTGRVLCNDFGGYLERHHFASLPISVEHARLAGRLEGTHRDPFDGMLAAQSIIEQIPLVTNDAAFAGFGVETMW
jgi:PIN domain nuclease of toxin-antitoxin system